MHLPTESNNLHKSAESRPGQFDLVAQKAAAGLQGLDLNGIVWFQFSAADMMSRPPLSGIPVQGAIHTRTYTYGEIAKKGKGWKFHLNFDPDDQDKVHTVSTLLPYLAKHAVITTYKIGYGGGKAVGAPGKEATVYVGHKDKADYVAPIIDQALTGILDPPEGDALTDDIVFFGNVAGRFEITNLDPRFGQYGYKGFPRLATAQYLPWITDPEARKAIGDTDRQSAFENLAATYGKFFLGSDPETTKNQLS